MVMVTNAALARSLTYDENIAFINPGVVDVVKDLGEKPVGKITIFGEVRDVLNRVIKILSKDITGINNKKDLIKAVKTIRFSLSNIKIALEWDKPLDIATEQSLFNERIKKIKFTSSIFSKTTTDTNKAIKALVQAWKDTLNQWSSKRASKQSPTTLKEEGTKKEKEKLS